MPARRRDRRPRTRVDEVLEETALGDRGKDRFRSYSLGMKQRLAIAATLLKTPDLLIFDEPTNGLDPAGIREIRTTMRSLGAQGKTVLVSSHILGEVEQVADSVSIIGHGRLLASGPVAEVIGQQAATSVRVGVADVEAAERVLLEGGLAVRRDAGLLLVDGRAGPGRGHPPAGPPRPLRQRARAGAGRPGVGLPAAHRAREPRGRPPDDARKVLR